MQQTPQRYRGFLFFLPGVLLLTISMMFWSRSGNAAHTALPIIAVQNPLEAAWQKMGEAQSYRFSADVVQRTFPALTLNNLGREAKTDTFTLQGMVFPSDNRLEMTLFQGEGSLLKPESGVQVRVEGERAYARVNAEDSWQEIQNFTGLFAPAGDALLFLKSAENVVLAESRADGWTRYTCDVNNAQFAIQLRQQLEAQLRQDGQLPPGLEVSLPEAYRKMQASGEFWLNAEGMPARQRLWIALPGTNPGERVQAEVDTTFEDFAFEPRNAALPWGLPRLPWLPIFQAAALTLGAGAVFWVFITFGSRRSFKIAFALTMMTAILVTPLLQSNQVRAYFETQTARQAELEQSAAPDAMTRTFEAQQTARQGILPAHTALTVLSADDGRDSDRDGLTDAQEAALGSSPFSVRNTTGLTDLQWAQQATVNGAFLLSDSGSDADGDGLTDYQEQMLGTSSSTTLLPETGQMQGVDSDFDGIGDYAEVRGFTFSSADYYGNPLVGDTNGDGLPDGVEWYVPTTTTIRDSDGDGVPDAFDEDNDGDGVPDRYDLSPFSATATVFDADNPLMFSVQNANAGAYLYAEFQLRPTDLNYLRYAFNVLDWPYDVQGQMKDLDGATFYDVDPTLPPNPNANGDLKLVPMLEIRTGSNPSGLPLTSTPPPVTVDLVGANTNALSGQVRITQQGADLHFQYSGLPGGALVHAIYNGTCGSLNATPVQTLTPNGSGLAILSGVGMEWLTNEARRSLVTSFSSDLNQGYACASLPILPQDGTQWVDTPLLANYAIHVVAALDGSGLTVYVPLQLTQVKDTAEKVAFYGKMLYQPATGWGNAHAVRLVWLIQALVDDCASDNVAACTRLNDVQVLHTYNGAFTLTGVNLREERGFETAIVYEDPTVDDNLYRDDTLMMFSQRMEQTFFAGYDCDSVASGACVGNGSPDFTLTEIERRFDHATNGSVTDEQRFGLPDFLSVRRFAYNHADQAMADMAQVQNKAVLHTVFTPYVGASNFYPLLLTLGWHRFRSANFENTAQAQWSGRALAFDLLNTPLVENANMGWQPFEYVSGQWQLLTMGQYWDELGARYAADFVSEPDEDVRAGSLNFVRMYFVSINHGVNRTVQINNAIQATSYQQTRPPIGLQIVGYGGLGAKFIVDLVYTMAVIDQINPSLTLAYLGALGNKLVNLAPGGGKILGLFKMEASAKVWAGRGAVIVGLALLAVVAVAALITYAIATKYKNNQGWKVVSQIGDTAITAVVVFLNAVKPAIAILKAAKAGADAFASITDVFGTSVIGAVIALVVNVAVIWGTFFYAWATGAIVPDTIAFNSFLALTIAQTLLAVLSFALSLTVWGALLVGIVTAIDAILSLLCKTFDVKTACFSIAGTAAEIVAATFYGATPTFDLTRARLGVVKDLDVSPADATLGMAAGAQVAIRATVFSSVPQNAAEGNPQAVARTAYHASQFFTPEALRRGTVRYSINDKSPVPEGQTYNNPAQPDSMTGAWSVSYEDTVIFYISNPGGLGQERVQFDIYRGEATLQTNVAYVTLTAGINSKVPATLYMDYSLPAAECWGNRRASVCNTKFIGNTAPVSLGDLGIILDVFPATLDEFYNWAALGTQRDRDADGLTATAVGGLDSNDANWDQDNDGLADGKENELRLDGIGTIWDTPAGFDSDGDGLNDRQELLRGTHPALADSDYDGLTDKQELDGWLWAYSFDGATLQTIVTADPNNADTDGDGNNDALERNIYQSQPLIYRYHPRQVNPALMTTITTISDLDGFLSPGQVFTYSVNVANTTFYTAPFGMEGNIAYAHSGETIGVPPVLTFGTLEAAFENLNAGQNTWVNTPVSVLSGSYANQDLTILSNVTGNLYNPGSVSSVSWVARPRVQFTPDGYYVDTGLPYFGALAAAPSNWSEPFVAAAVVMDGVQISGRYRGELHAYALRDTARSLAPIQALDTPYPLRESAPAIACAANRCLIVWTAFPIGATYPELHARLLTAGGGTFNPEFRIAPGQSCAQLNPAVASNGVDFVVTWACDTLVHAAAVSNTQSGDVTGYYPFSDSGSFTHTPRSTVTWAGDRYVVAFTRRNAENQLDLYGIHLDSNAAPLGWMSEVAIFSSVDNEHLPSLAYNPTGNNLLLTYNLSASAADPANTFCRVRGAVLPISAFTPSTTFDISSTICQHYGSSVAYDPRNGNWAVAYVSKNGNKYQTTLQEYNSSGTASGSAHILTYGSLSINPIEPALACNSLDCALLTYSDVVARPGERNLFFDRQALKAQYPHIGAATDSDTVRVRVDTGQPSVSAISGLPADRIVRAGGYYIIGGTASDSFSGIEKIDVQVNLGAWQPAQGASTWLYGLNVPSTEGSFLLLARATDYGGNTRNQGVLLYADATPPTFTVNPADETQLTLQTNVENRFVIPLSGSIADPVLAGGTATDQTHLTLAVHISPNSSGWQTATISGGTWTLNYPLAAFDVNGENLLDPTAYYTVTVRATDAVGNRTPETAYYTFNLRVDNNAPQSAWLSPDPGTPVAYLDGVLVTPATTATYTASLVISGTLAETGTVHSGVAAAEVRFTPLEDSVPPGLWRAQYFDNATQSGAPLLQRTEDALTFDWGSSAPDSALPADGFSARYTRDILLRASGQYTFTLNKDSDSTAAIWVDGIRQLDLATGATTGTITLTLSLGTHAFVVDYADLGGAATLGWRGNLQAPAWISVDAAHPGAAASSWRSAIPSGLEGFYRLDLRGRDLQGNLSSLTLPAIEAEIDAAAPRIFYEMTYSGLGNSAQTHFTFLATDLNLSENGLLTPCDLTADSRRTLQTDYTDAYGSGAPRLYQIFVQCSAAGHLLNKPAAQACDAYGQCATADAVNLTDTDARTVYLTLADGSLVEANLRNAVQRTLATGLPGMVTVDRTDGAVFYPDTAAQLFRYAAVYSSTTPAFTDTALAQDYAAATTRMFALEANALRYANKDGSAAGSLGVQNAYSLGLSSGGSVVWVAATMPDGVSGRIYAWNSSLSQWARLDGLDPSLYNSWRAVSVAHDVQRSQLYLAGWCGDPLTGTGPAPRTAIYGIHRLAAPILAPAGFVQTNVTGCIPIIRETDPHVTIGRVRVDDFARKIYFTRNNSITGEYALWRAELDGSLQQLVYVAAQPISDFDVAENRPPQPYPPSAVVRADENVNIRLFAYDTYDNDPLRFSILTPPRNGWVSAPAPSVTTANETWIQYTPVVSYTGSDSFVVQVDDGRGGIAAATVNVTVLSPYLVESAVISYTTPITQTSAYGNVTLFANLGEPITLTLHLQAERGLGQLIVRADGSMVSNQSLSHLGGITETLYNVTFYPGAPGAHTLTTELRDSFGKWQTNLYPRTLYVAHEYPQIVVTPTVLTTTHQTWNGWLQIMGTTQSVAGARYVTVDVAGVGRAFNRAPVGDTWQAWANVGLPPDNVNYTVTATIEDALGVPTTTITTITADLVVPSEMTVSIGVQGGPALNVGDTVRETAPVLTLDWAEATDGAGISGYYAGWSTNPVPERSALTFYAMPVTHLQSGFADAQAYYAHVGARDNHGNIRWQTFGPIYLDAPTTPDLVDQTGYDGWLNSTGAQLAADYDAAGNSAYHPVQRVFASWNTATFALAWTGTDIYNFTDLYAYFDTGAAGGAAQAWLPGSATPVTATLPTGFSADYMLRVTRDATILYQWDGMAWSNPQTAGGVAGFRSEFSMWQNDRVRVRIPFSLLGITNPNTTTLRLLTLAAERDTARFWAAAPDKNPLNSLRAADAGAWRTNALHTFTFTQQAVFPSLGSGVIPNGSLFRDSNLRLWLTANPGGLMIGYLDSSRFTQLIPGVPLDADSDGVLDRLTDYTADFVPLEDGQTVTYTLYYANTGTQAAEGVTLNLMSSGAITGAPVVLNLGSIAAGSSGSLTFTAQVNNPGNLLGSGEIMAVVSDARHTPYDWLWGLHVTRAVAPSQVTLPGADGSAVQYVTQWTSGNAYDRVGLYAAELRLTRPDTGVSVMPCFVSSSNHLAFTCIWTPTATGAHTLEARVQNLLGVWSDWSAPASVIVDNTAPSLAFDAATLSRLTTISNGAFMPFSGLATDDVRLGRIQVCLIDTGFATSCAESLLSGTNVAWSLQVPMPWQRDGGAVNYEAILYDAAGSPSTVLSGSFNFDNQYPTGGVYRTPDQRFYSEFHHQPLENTPPVCAGTVWDGTPVFVSGFWQGEGIPATPITPTLNVTTTFGLLRHDFDIRLPLDRAGTFSVNLTARDTAGNVSVLPACVVDVTPEVDLGLQVAASPTTTLLTNGVVTYTYLITNSSLLTATESALSIYPGDHASPLNPNSALELLAVQGAVCDVTSYGWYSCALPELGRNASHEVTFRYLAHVQTPFTNTVNASVLPNGFDVDYNNQLNRTASVYASLMFDLSLRVHAPETIPYGTGIITYTANLTNAGPSPLLAAENMGARLYFNFRNVGYTTTSSGAGWACSIPGEFGGSLMVCDHAGFPVGTLPPLTLRLNVGADTEVPVNVQMYQSTWGYDTSPGNDSVEITTTIQISPDVGVQAALMPATVNPLGTTHLTITATNSGPTAMPYATVTMPLPSGVTIDTAGTNCGGVSSLVCSVNRPFLPGETRAFTATLRVWDAGVHNTTLAFTGTIVLNTGSDPNPANNTFTTMLSVLPRVDLQVAPQDSTVYGYLGVPLTYTLQVQNLGPDNATGAITLTHTIPNDLQYEGFDGAGWACTFAAGTLTCSHAALLFGNTAPLSVRVRPQAPGSFSGSVSLMGPDFDFWNGDNNATQSFYINDSADLRLTKSASVDVVNPGDTLNYVLRITNQAVTAPTAWVVLTDTLPAHVMYTGFTASRSFINCAHSSGTVTCDANAGSSSAYALYAGETWTITLQTQVLAGSGTFTNTAIVTHGQPDPTPADLTANAAVSYASLPTTADWHVFKTAVTANGSTFGFDSSSKVVAPAAPGEQIRYEIGVQHTSTAHPWNFRDIVLTDTLPNGVTFAGWIDNSAFTRCGNSGQIVTCTLSLLPYSGSMFGTTRVAEFYATVPMTVGIYLTNTIASASLTMTDTNLTDNSDYATVQIVKPIDLNLSILRQTPAVVYPGDPFSLTFEVSNFLTQTVDQLRLRYQHTPDVTLLGATDWVCTPSSGATTCVYPAGLAGGAVLPVTITMQAATVGTFYLDFTLFGTLYEFDVNSWDNQSNHMLKVFSPADLQLVKTSNRGSVTPGGLLTYTLGITNLGSGAATAIRLTDTLPAGVQFVTYTASLPSTACAYAGGALACQVTPAGRLLVVDESIYGDASSNLRSVLDNMGIMYTFINGTPNAATLAAYDAVIWTTYPNPPPSVSGISALQTYLDGGGKLLLIAPGYANAVGGTPDTLMTTHLGVAAVSTYASDYVDDFTGQNAFATIGSVNPYDWWADALQPNAQAQVAVMAHHLSGASNPAALYTARTVFFALNWSSLYDNHPAYATALLNTALNRLIRPLRNGESAQIQVRVRAPLALGDFVNSTQVSTQNRDSNLINNTDVLTLTAALLPQSGNGPGGVADTDGKDALVLWLRADQGSSAASGQPVVAWLDQSGYAHNATGGAALLSSGFANAQPALTFSATVPYTIANFRLDEPYTVFIVAQQNGAVQNALLTNPTGAWQFGPANGNDVLTLPGWTFSQAGSSDAAIYMAWQDAGGAAFYKNGALLGLGTPAAYPGGVLLGGRSGTLSDGKLAEVIVLRGVLNNVHRTLIHNYLSAKYDIPLVTGDLFPGDDPGNGNFDHVVAGIGREADGMHPLAHSAGLYLMAAGFLQDNGDYLIMGHNGLTGNTTADLPSGGLWDYGVGQRWTRAWYIAKADANSNGGMLTLVFDLSEGGMIGTPLPPASNYRLLKRSALTGAFSDIATATRIEGDQIIFEGVDASLIGSHFTLGTVDSSSPTAVQLTRFEAVSRAWWQQLWDWLWRQ